MGWLVREWPLMHPLVDLSADQLVLCSSGPAADDDDAASKLEEPSSSSDLRQPLLPAETPLYTVALQARPRKRYFLYIFQGLIFVKLHVAVLSSFIIFAAFFGPFAINF